MHTSPPTIRAEPEQAARAGCTDLHEHHEHGGRIETRKGQVNFTCKKIGARLTWYQSTPRQVPSWERSFGTGLHMLQTAYAQAEGARPPFAEAVAAVLARYKDASLTESSRRTKISNHWATPDKLMTGLTQSLSLTTERFDSPLNFCTGMSSYYAVNQEDQAFGAYFNAFSIPWLGDSQAYSEYEAADMDKAVRWAIMIAASTEEASLTAFILPEWPRTAYYKYMTDFRVHHLVTEPKDKFRFKTPNFWNTGQTYASHPNWNIKICVVANLMGLQYIKPQQLKQALQHALPGVIMPSMPSMDSMITRLHANTGSVHLSRAFWRVRDRLESPKCWNSASQDLPLHLAEPQAGAYPLAPTIIYKDGSASESSQGQRIGAGVYCTEPSMQLKMDPCGISATNTITRAKLVAIHAALQEVGSHDCTIATGSLASTFSPKRAVRADPCHNESPHAVLLTEIAKPILHRSQLNLRTAIIKVKSYTGVQGNEMADQLANAARQPAHCQLSISLGNHAFNNQMWPQIL